MADFRTEYEKVYENIRDAILAGDFKAGDKLPQRKLAEMYNATTITVREALRALQSDGLIVIEPKWGAMVTEMTPEAIQGRYIVRAALEGMAARLAAKKINSEERRELLVLASKCDKELTSNKLNRQEKAHLHYQLHKKIVEITKCKELIRSINRINLQAIIFSNAYHIDWTHDDPERHRKLVKSIISKDPDTAERVMRTHVEDGYKMEMKAMDSSMPIPPLDC